MYRTLIALFAFGLLLAAPACGSPRPEDPAATHEILKFEIPPAKKGVTYLRTIVFGDFGTGTSDQHAVAKAMVTRVRREKAKVPLDLMITTGDNFYPSGVESADDSQWKSKYEEVYKAKELQVDVRPSLGNHDHKQSIQAQIDYGKRNKRWKLPSRYYTFSHDLDDQSVQFFAVDTTPLGWRKNDPEQLKWLDETLAASKARWKIVIGHHPIYSHSKRPYNTSLIRRLEPLLVKHKVDVYLAGHDHVLEMVKPIKGVHYVVSGAAAGPRKAYPVRWTDKSYYAATNGGFVWMRVSKDELVLEFVRMKGETQFAHVLRKGRSGPF
jgi:tartrate-resistant acid phosphatase type 5